MAPGSCAFCCLVMGEVPRGPAYLPEALTLQWVELFRAKVYSVDVVFELFAFMR